MSLESQIANLVDAANNLTGEVAGKMRQIDNKVDAATQAVPKTIREYAKQAFYVDAFIGDDQNDGRQNSPVRTINALNDRIVNGSSVMIYLRSGQSHYINRVGVSLQTGSITVINWGDGARPHIHQLTEYSEYNDKHYGNGFQVQTGSILFRGVNISTIFEPDNPEGVELLPQAGLVGDSQGHMSIHFYNCNINLSNMPVAAAFSGFTGRDIYLSGCNIAINKNQNGRAKLLMSRTGGNYACFKLDVYATSLQEGITWSDIVDFYSDKRNLFTNLGLA